MPLPVYYSHVWMEQTSQGEAVAPEAQTVVSPAGMTGDLIQQTSSSVIS